jgi:hypothetical protein
MSEPGIVLYDPTAERRLRSVPLAPRLAGLAGRRAGILDNGKANAGTLMLAVVERLRSSHGVAGVVKRDKPVAGPTAPDIVEALSTCDFVLVGSAD